MDKIKCPACGAEIDADLENCPSCGAPVGTMREQEISGTPIDNKEAIDSMLEKANMLVEEGKELGIEGLDDEPSEELDTYGDDAVPGIPKGDESGQPADILAVENDPGITLFEMDDLGNVITEEKPEPKKAKKQKVKRERRNSSKTESHDNTKVDANNVSKNKKNKKKASKGIVFLAVVISLLAGIAVGFFGKLFLFPDMPAPTCQTFAEKAVKSVNSILNSDQEMFVAESYVKEFSVSTQCLIRTFVTEEGSVSEKWYRVRVDNDDSKKINVYTQYSEDELDKMYNSSDDAEKAKAAVLAGIQEETDRLIAEMQQGSGWVEVNPSLLNNAIHPYSLSAESKDVKD